MIPATIIDLALLAVFLAQAIRGYLRGFTKIILSVVRLVLSTLAAVLLGGRVAVWLCGLTGIPTPVAAILGYLVVYFAVYAGLGGVIYLITRLTKLPVLSVADKLLGLALGVVCGVITTVFLAAVVGLILTVANKGDIVEASRVLTLFDDLRSELLVVFERG